MNKPTFQKYIEILGDEAASRLFGVKRRTVKSWRLGYRFPRAKDIPALIEATGGKIGYESFFPANTKPRPEVRYSTNSGQGQEKRHS